VNENTWGDSLRKRIAHLESQVEELEAQRDEAGMRYTEHDEDRMIRVRASEWQQGADRIKELTETARQLFNEGVAAKSRVRELEAELAALKGIGAIQRKQHAEAMDLAAEVDRLRAYLKQLEWLPYPGAAGYAALFCPACSASKSQKHLQDCWLAAECKEGK